MQVQRQFFEVRSRQLLIELPESFIDHRVEVIALTVDEPSPLAVPAACRQPHPELDGQGQLQGDSVNPLTMDGDAFAELGNEVRALIANSEPVVLGPFRLDLTGFLFDREDANAR